MRPAAILVLALCTALGACVTSAPVTGVPARGGDSADTGRDLTPVDDADPLDAGDADRDPQTGEDTAPDIVSVLDVAVDTTGRDAEADSGPGDTGPREDTGPCVGIGCACTVSTRSVVCGRLPCVDGFCCESSCDGDCQGCGVPGSEGTCAFHAAGVDPDDDCRAQSEASCGRDGTCDGAGGCRLFGDETACDDGEACSVGDVCDGAGTCRGEVPGTCGPGAGNECCVGTCSDGSGCATAAAACGDVCGAAALTIGRTCAGCGAPGAVGVCAGGGTHRCDATNHAECQELSCGGVRYFCTNADGVWAWRPTGTCDDGDACTHSDRCGGGECIGTALSCADTVCADRACNGTSTCTVTPRPGTACDDGNACTYEDRCDAAGACVGGRSVSCVDGPCIDRECTGGPTCSETILTGSSCADGNACTYGDHCTAEGLCVAGGTVTCTGLDTACRAYACDGTSVCASTPRNVGGACDDGNPATDFDTCRADGVCVGDTGCPPPSEACVAGSQNRRGCGGARVISRLSAGSGWSISDSTCSARDDFNDTSGCWDANGDHSYRLYMREGESVSVRYRTATACVGGTWNGTLKIFETGGCDNLTCGAKVYCDYNERDQSTTYVAVRDGWVVLVADGSHASDDDGAYTLTVTLSCRAGNCGCL